MKTLIEALGEQNLGAVMGMLTVGAVVITLVGIIQWRKHRQALMETDLKREMLERGMSAEEIVAVLSASQDKPRPPSPSKRSPSKQTADYAG